MNYIVLFLAVALGYFVAIIFYKKEMKQLPILLAFSGAFLLSVTLFELLPEVFEKPSKRIGMFIMGGILLQIILDFFSKGAEHGHVHIHSEKKGFPWLLFISLSIHALLEGFPVHENQSVLIGVLVHKIPIALILALFFTKAGYGKTVTAVFMLLFGIMTPLGSFLSSELLVFDSISTEINALTIGVFLHVSTTILFESSKDHKFNLVKLISIILAVGLAYLV